MKLHSATLTINEDEPAFNLSEVNLQEGHGWRRYQIVTVIRGERFAQWWDDLGPRSSHTADQFRIVGGVPVGKGRIECLHTVGELRAMADRLRAGALLKFDYEPTNWASAYYDALDTAKLVRRHQSVSGPAVTIQR